MLNEKVLQALTFQMQHEKQNSYVYRSFSGIADYLSLTGTTSWFKKQSDEENNHFEIIANYIQDQGHIPHLLNIMEQVPQNLTLFDMFSRTVEIELNTTEMLKQVSFICKEENDDQTYQMILGLLTEQIEEVKMVTDIFNRIQLAGTGFGTIIIDQELGQR